MNSIILEELPLSIVKKLAKILREVFYMKHYRHKWTLPAIIISLAIVIIVLFFAVNNYFKQTTLPHGDNLSVIGVELNQDRPNVDLHQLQNHGVSFVYLKGTQGKSYFDDSYDIYRDQIQGTKMAFGTIVTISNESSIQDQWQYYQAKIGSNSGSLPVILIPAVQSSDGKFLQKIAKFAQLLMMTNKKVMVMTDYANHKYFPENTKYLAFTTNLPNKNKNQYAFWRYTTTGRVNKVAGLEQNVTMFTYNGSVSQYKAQYGQLIQ